MQSHYKGLRVKMIRGLDPNKAHGHSLISIRMLSTKSKVPVFGVILVRIYFVSLRI